MVRTNSTRQTNRRTRNHAFRSSGLEPLEDRRLLAVLQPGDTNQDLYFDEADFIMAHKAGLFETGEPATWSEGDWTGAPGGEPGNPPIGDDEFNSSDYVAAFITGNYRIGPYDPEAGEPQHERTPLVTENGNGVAVIYDAETGKVEVVTARPIDTFQLYSTSGLFLGPATEQRPGLFDFYNAHGVFRLDPSGIGIVGPSIDGNLLPPGLAADALIADLEADGSFRGGGDIGDVLLVCAKCFEGETGDVTAVVFEDANGNGVQDDGEVGVDDQTIIVQGLGDLSWLNRQLVSDSFDLNGDAQIDPQTEQGINSFVGLPLGRYEVTLVTDESSLVIATHPASGVQEIEITEAQPSAELQFGVRRIEPATVQGQVFLDANENGEFDPGEEALGFREIQLRASDTNRLLHQELTMADGTFEFLEIVPGEYRITADLPLGQVLLADVGLTTLREGQQHQANLPVVNRPYLLPGDANQDYYVDPADFILTHKSGKFQTGESASWEEGDWDGGPGGTVGSPPVGDGVFDARDYVAAFTTGVFHTGGYNDIAGQPVHARMPLSVNPNANVVLTYDAIDGSLLVVSDTPLTTFHLFSSNGSIDASNRPAVLSGLLDVYDEQNMFYLDPARPLQQRSLEFPRTLPANLTISSLLNDLEVDGSLSGGGGLGEVGLVCLNCFDGEPATVQGQIYDDVNRNGQQDPGEVGVDGWTVQLVNSGEFAANVRVTTSSIDLNEDGQIDPLTESGIYQFTGFGPGQVTAIIQTPVGWVAQPSPALEVSIAEGEQATLPASGYYQQQFAHIVVQVFEDANGNGDWDEDEPALEAIRIRLDSSAGTSEIEYTELQDLDQDGSVSVDEAGALFQVLPGSYDLTSTLRDTGWTFTDDAQGEYAVDVAEAETIVIHVGQQRPVRGDLNGDRMVDSVDVDALYQAIRDGSRDLRYDLTGDRRIDRSDMAVLIEDILGTSIGDVNFDGRFDSADLVLVLQAGQYEDNVAENSTYRTGDWTGNGEFDAFDLVFAFQRGGFVREAVAATSVRVPFATTNPELAAALQPIHRTEDSSPDSDQTNHQHRLQTVAQKIQLQDRIFASLFV